MDLQHYFRAAWWSASGLGYVGTVAGGVAVEVGYAHMVNKPILSY
jgi:hypothetical protein